MHLIAFDGLPHQVDQLEGSLLSEKSAVEERAAQSAAEPLKRCLERKETALRSMKLKLEVVQAELNGSRAELEGAKAEVAKREDLRAFTLPAMWIAPECSSSFSVSVVLPASGCEMMAKVRRRAIWRAMLTGGVSDG